MCRCGFLIEWSWALFGLSRSDQVGFLLGLIGEMCLMDWHCHFIWDKNMGSGNGHRLKCRNHSN